MTAFIGRREFITCSAAGQRRGRWRRVRSSRRSSRLLGLLCPGYARFLRPRGERLCTQRLRELGWIEGRYCRDRISLGRSHPKRFDEIVNEFVRLKVDVIFTGGTPLGYRGPEGNRPTFRSCSWAAGDPVGHRLGREPGRGQE